MALGPVTAAATYSAVVERLRRAIYLGTYIAGERLPPERVLAPQLGVARATLREALRVLEGEGYLEIRRGATGGAMVLAGPTQASEPRASLRDRIAEFEEVLDFRLAVEGSAARLAAGRRTDQDLTMLGATLDGMRRHTSMALFRRADSAFHLAIADVARNAMLRRAVEDGRVGMFLPLETLDFEVMLATAMEGHRKILGAITLGDPSGAERAMIAHIEDTRRELRLVLTVAADVAG